MNNTRVYKEKEALILTLKESIFNTLWSSHIPRSQVVETSQQSTLQLNKTFCLSNVNI